MIKLVMCLRRRSDLTREQWLDNRRKSLQERMRRRRKKSPAAKARRLF